MISVADASFSGHHALWWGDYDKFYSRNAILHKLFAGLGWRQTRFNPLSGRLGGVEATLRRLPSPDLVILPSFRHREYRAAISWASARCVPLLADPLISVYDKLVFEREKFPEQSRRAFRTREWESRLYNSVDVLLADTTEHARFFADAFRVDPRRIYVVYVGAEESVFSPRVSPVASESNAVPEAFFYGSFLRLQGPDVIVEAARLAKGEPIRWTLLGDGPMKSECVHRATGLPNIAFEDPIPYTSLPDRIAKADILLGIFGDTRKAASVIPNKVFQALACGKPLVTRESAAYPGGSGCTGIEFIPPASPDALVRSVRSLALDPGRRRQLCRDGRALFDEVFSESALRNQLHVALSSLHLPISCMSEV